MTQADIDAEVKRIIAAGEAPLFRDLAHRKRIVLRGEVFPR